MQTARVVAPLVSIVLISGCARTPPFIEHDEQSNAQARLAPLVVVGIADFDAPVGNTTPSRRDPSYPMQLHRVRVRVENVLRGELSERTLTVYYFGFAGGFDGPRPLGFGPRPSRRILGLSRDHGALRMACDGWDVCTMFVDSGAHPRYRTDPQESLDQAVAEIILTRGEGKIDEGQFARAVEWGVPDQGIQAYVIEKLKRLALTESPAIKRSACHLLWIYSQDRTDERLRQYAQDTLRDAHCRCATPAFRGLPQVCC